jgi:hypothetical protein
MKRASTTIAAWPGDSGSDRTIHELLLQKRSLEWWNLAMLVVISVTAQGVFDDVKANYLRNVAPLFLIALQGCVCTFFIICLWYILRRLAPINEKLDASRHVEHQLNAIRAAHRQTQDDIASLREPLQQIRDMMPAGGTLTAFYADTQSEAPLQ